MLCALEVVQAPDPRWIGQITALLRRPAYTEALHAGPFGLFKPPVASFPIGDLLASVLRGGSSLAEVNSLKFTQGCRVQYHEYKKPYYYSSAPTRIS